MRIGDEGGRETRHTSSGGAGRVALPWRVEAVLMFAVPSRNSIAGKRKKSARRSPLLRRLGRLDGADALPPCSSLWCGAWRAVSRPQRGGGVMGGVLGLEESDFIADLDHGSRRTAGTASGHV